MEHLLPGFHVLFAALLVGGQVLLFFAVIPSTWLIDDEGLRRRVTLVVAHRFTWIVGISLVGLIVTGLAQFYTDIFVPPGIREDMMEFHFGRVFMVKMLFVTILIIMIAVHGAVFGQRIGRISDAVQAGELDRGELEQARRTSMVFSILMVLVSIVLIFLGASLGNHAYSHDPL
ncbi:MAG: hypothetical protein F4X25_04910 [Chloroflexi bacterium]|nr:hypothetical protein [Chloroflexota bacterium]